MGWRPDASEHVVLFRGSRVQRPRSYDYLGNTWTWDGSSWTQRHPACLPSKRSGMFMAFDEATGQVLLYGGTDGYTYGGDT